LNFGDQIYPVIFFPGDSVLPTRGHVHYETVFNAGRV